MGLRRPGFSEWKLAPSGLAGLIGVSLAGALAWLSEGQEFRGHRQCGSGQPGLLSAKWRGRLVCHVFVARGRSSHADWEVGGGRGSTGQEAEAASLTATLPWAHKLRARGGPWGPRFSPRWTCTQGGRKCEGPLWLSQGWRLDRHFVGRSQVC